jgi:glucokinase
MILAGDIGGTKTVLALYDAAGAGLRQAREGTFPSRDHATFAEVLRAFLGGDRPALRAACFGVAGPVLDGKVKATNLPWSLDEASLSAVLGGARVKLLNDLEAMAYGALFLRPDELASLNPSAAPWRRGNVAVIAAGTGLGEAILYWDGERHHPLATEGGHCDFAPQTDQEIELLRYLRHKYNGHVSYERILSGPGLHDVFCFLRDSGGAVTAALEKKLDAGGDPSAAVGGAGLDGSDPLAVQAVDLFLSIYGAEAGNLALKCLATGGVFVGGGIGPKLLPALRRGAFVRGFCDKGRFGDLLASLPVDVALNPHTPLLGAAHYAARLAG